MKFKYYVYFSIMLSVILVLVISQVVHYSTVSNPLYEFSQQRVKESSISNEIVFVGDSSLAASIDKEYFSALMNDKKVSNLSLTSGAHNFAATYNMIRHTLNNNKEVKYIVIMHTPSAWSDNFVMPGYCSTVNELSSEQPIKLGLVGRMQCFEYHYFNFMAIYDNIIQRTRKPDVNKTYKNGGRNIFYEMKKNMYKSLNEISPHKLVELQMMDDYLKDKNVKVLYVQGPLHYQLSLKYRKAIEKQHDILRKMNNIQFIEKYKYPRSENMGNTENHVDESYKKESTKFYFSVLKDYLK